MSQASHIAGRMLKIALKTVAWLAGGAVGLVIVLLIAVNFLLQTGFFTRFVLDRALPPVEKLTCSKIEVERLRLSLLPFSLLVEGVRYTDPQEKFKYPFAKLKRLYVHVKTAPLLRGQVVVDEVSVEGAESYLFVRDGLENLPICPTPPKPKKPFKPFKVKLPIVVKKLHVDAKFRMDMPSITPAPTPDNPNPAPRQPLAVTVDSINLDADGNLNRGDVAAKLRLLGVAASFGEMRDQVQSLSLDAEANLQTWIAKVTQLAVEMPDLRLGATAQAADLLGEMDLSSDVQLAVDLHKVNQLVLAQPGDPQLFGLLNLNAKARLKLAKDQLIWAAEGRLALPQGEVNHLPLRDLRAEFVVSPERAHLTSFHAGIGQQGAVDVTGKVGLRDVMPLDADVRLANLNVGDILARFGQGKLGVAAVVGANLHASGQIKPLLVDASGNVALGSVRYRDQVRLDRLTMRLDATIDQTSPERLRFSAKTAMDLQDLAYRDQAEVARGTINLDAHGSVPAKKGPPIDAVAVGDVLLEEVAYGQTKLSRVNVSLDAQAHVGAAIAYEAKVDLLAEELAQGETIKVRKVELTLDAGGNANANDVRELKLAIDGVRVNQAEIPHAGLNVAGLFGPKKNLIRQFLLTTAHTRMEVAGGFDLEGGPIDVTADLQLGDLSEFAALVGKPMRGSGSMHLHASGSTENPQAEGKLEFADLVFDTINVRHLSAGLGLANNRATVSQLVVESEGAHLSFDGWYDLNESTAQALLDMPETQIEALLALAGMQDRIKVAGMVSLHADVSGPVAALNGAVTMTGDQITAYDESLRSLRLNARLAEGEILLDDLTLIKDRGIRPLIQRGIWQPRPESLITAADRQPTKITLSGHLNPNDRSFALKLHTENLSETSSNAVARQRLHVMADLGLTADVEGTFDNPNGALELNIDRGRYEHFDLGHSSIRVDFAEQKIHLTGALLAQRKPFAPDDEIIPRPGRQARGDDPDFAEDGAYRVAQAQGAPVPPPAGEDPFGSIRLDATLSLTEARPYSAHVWFDRFDYSSFLKSAEQARQQRRQQAEDGARRPPANEGKLAGLIAGEIVVDGRLGPSGAGPAADTAGPASTNGPAFNAAVRFDQIFFQRNRLIIRNQNEQGEVKPIIITYRDGRVDVQDFALGGSGMRIKIERQDLNGEPYFVLDGQAPLTVAKDFSDAIASAEGMLQLHAEIPMKFDLGKVTAGAKIDKASIDLADMPSVIENLKVDIEFANRAATVRECSADLGGGKLRVGGSYRLPQAAQGEAGPGQAPAEAGPGQAGADHAQLELFVKVENVKTRYDPYLELTVRKIDLLITTRPDGKLEISGEVDIDKAVLRYNIDIVQILQTFQKTGGGSSGSQVYEKKEESVYFNIVIRAPRGVSVDNNFVQIEMSLDLVLTGNNVDPGMIGTIQVLKGQAVVLQNTYQVSSAVIQFFDETRIYPAFDINAVTVVNEIAIYINVSGTPDRYQITFQSDPPMTERDIVTLLSLGVSYEQFQAGSADEGAALAAAAQQLIGSQFRQYTGVDFGVDTSTGVSRLRVSRELEKNVLLSLFRGIAEPALSAELEWDFVRYLAVYGDWSDFAGQENVPSWGGAGAGIRVKIEFR